jgi:hypothetical protein
MLVYIDTVHVTVAVEQYLVTCHAMIGYKFCEHCIVAHCM